MEKEQESQKKTPLTRDQAQIRKKLVTADDGSYNMRYNLFLTIRRANDKNKDDKFEFDGNVEILFDYHPKPDVKESDFFLNFVGEVKKIKVNDTVDEHFKYENHRLTINLGLLKQNEQNKINVIFRGNYNHSGVGLHHFIDPIDKKEYLYTQFEPYDCNRLFPVFDQPDIKAVLDLTVIAPEEWIVLSNEYEEEKEGFAFTDPNSLSKFNLDKDALDILVNNYDIKSKKYVLHKFKSTPKISTYLYALCAGAYVCIKNTFESPVPLRLFMRESLKNSGEPEEVFKVTIAGMKFYKDYFGIEYPFTKYDQIFCPEYNMGAMENVGLVTHNEYYCWKDPPSHRRRTGFAITILHELAHMWFGDLVTMKWWDDLWLNESFATFISHLCLANSKDLNERYTTSWVLFGEYKGYAYTADQLPTTHPVMCDVVDTEVAETHFDEIVYEKGSSMLKQMYYFIGDEIFSKGLKDYFSTYKWGNTSFDDFIGKMVEASKGKLDNLRELCSNWLKKAGLNEITLDMEINESDKKIKKFVIKQKPCLEAHPNLQTHMVDILFIYDFKDDKANKVFQKIIIEPKEETVLDFSKEVAPKVVFLNYNDWGYMKLNFDKHSIDSFREGLIHLNDPLSKQLISRSLFDQCRDAKVSSIEYLEIVLGVLEKEQNENIMGSLLRSISGVIQNYIPLKYNEKYKKQLFDLIVKLLERELGQTPINKDIIKQLFLYISSYCTNDEDRKILIGFLSDKPELNGKAFDAKLISQEDRFRFVTNIYKSKTISKEDKEKYLNQEVEKDKNSNDSVMVKLTCSAIVPDLKVKEELWAKFCNPPKSESLYNLEALARGFAPLDQLDLVKDFLKVKFFEALPQVGKNNETFYVKNFIDYLSPNMFVEEEMIKKLEELVEKVKDLPQVKRYIMEEVDLMKRKLITHKLCEEYLSQKS